MRHCLPDFAVCKSNCWNFCGGKCHTLASAIFCVENIPLRNPSFTLAILVGNARSSLLDRGLKESFVRVKQDTDLGSGSTIDVCRCFYVTRGIRCPSHARRTPALPGIHVLPAINLSTVNCMLVTHPSLPAIHLPAPTSYPASTSCPPSLCLGFAFLPA
jgi:hypothetical protein